MTVSSDLGTSYDVIVVGGSFAGLAAATQLARARRRVLVLDAGSPRNRFSPAAHGFLGHDGRPPAEILEMARTQLRAYPTAEFRRARATDAAGERDRGFAVTLAGEGEDVAAAPAAAVVRANRLILATGVRDHLPEIPGLADLWGTGVLHCPYCHGFEVAGRPLAVLHALAAAASVHQATLLRDWSDDVTLLTNGEAAGPIGAEDRQRLAARGVRIEDAPVARVVAAAAAAEGGGAGRRLEAVELADDRRLLFAGLFLAPRTTQAGPLAEQLGCAFDDGAFGPVVRTDETRQTTVPGVFAAGDAAARAAHSVTFAVADGATAGFAAHRSLVFPEG